ncbi:hypothetical protein ABIE35_004100 [Paenarthrobacter sp. 4246]
MLQWAVQSNSIKSRIAAINHSSIEAYSFAE